MFQQLIAQGHPDATRIWQQMRQQQAANSKQEVAIQEYYRQMNAAMQQLAAAAQQQFNGTELEILAFSKKPRPVDFKPYELSDLKAKNYDVKSQKGYWQLARSNPNETDELAAKVGDGGAGELRCEIQLNSVSATLPTTRVLLLATSQMFSIQNAYFCVSPPPPSRPAAQGDGGAAQVR